MTRGIKTLNLATLGSGAKSLQRGGVRIMVVEKKNNGKTEDTVY